MVQLAGCGKLIMFYIIASTVCMRTPSQVLVFLDELTSGKLPQNKILWAAAIQNALQLKAFLFSADDRWDD